MTADREPAPAPPWSSAPAFSQPDPTQPLKDGGAQADGGRYALRELLGRGGMGEVWVARDTLLGRDVALKRVHPGTRAESLLREANLAALLEHPGIVPVHDAVVLPDGSAWYVMRLVRGRNLAQALADLPEELPAQAEARCRLVTHVIDAGRAVAFAHSVGVLHRDLKSDNLLIGELGDTQVADWGLAARSDDADGELRAAPAGCPAYLSPQRALGAAFTVQDDVFALGAVLYEIVAGWPPFAEREVEGQWRRARAGDRVQPGVVWTHMPPELRAIAAKATDPEPAARYASVSELVADLERWASGRRVQAHTYSPFELTQRFVATFRLPLTVASVALALVVLLVALGVRRIAGERDQAEAARKAETRAHEAAQFQLAETLAMQARTLAQAGDRPAAETSAAQALGRFDHPLARGVLAGFALQPRPVPVPVSVPWPCNHVRIGADGQCIACLGDDEVRWQCGAQPGRWANQAYDLAFSAADDRVALAQASTLTVARLDGTVVYGRVLPAGRTRLLQANRTSMTGVVENTGAWVFDLRTFSAGLRVRCAPTQLLAAALRPDGRRLVAACAGGTYVVADGAGESTFAAPWIDQMRGIVELALPSDHTTVALGIDGSLAVLDAATGQLRAAWRAGGVAELSALLVPPETSVAVVLGAVGGVAWVRLADGAVLGRAPAVGARYLAGLGGGGVAATGVRVGAWRVPAAPVPVVLDAAAGLTSVDGSADGRWLAAGAGTGELVVWSMPTGVVALRMRVCGNTAKDVQFDTTSNALLVACVGAPGLVRLTYAAGRWQPPTTVATIEARRAGALASGRVWLTDSVQGLRVLQDRAVVWWIHGPGFVDGDTAADGARAFVVGPRGAVWHIDDNGGAPIERWPAAAAVAVGTSADGQVVAMASTATVVAVNVRDGSTRHAAAVATGVQDVAVSGDGRLVAVAHIDGAITVLGDRPEMARLTGHRQRTVAVRFLPGAKALASASWDGTVRLWSLRALVERPETLAAEAENAWR